MQVLGFRSVRFARAQRVELRRYATDGSRRFRPHTSRPGAGRICLGVRRRRSLCPRTCPSLSTAMRYELAGQSANAKLSLSLCLCLPAPVCPDLRALASHVSEVSCADPPLPSSGRQLTVARRTVPSGGGGTVNSLRKCGHRVRISRSRRRETAVSKARKCGHGVRGHHDQGGVKQRSSMRCMVERAGLWPCCGPGG